MERRARGEHWLEETLEAGYGIVTSKKDAPWEDSWMLRQGDLQYLVRSSYLATAVPDYCRDAF